MQPNRRAKRWLRASRVESRRNALSFHDRAFDGIELPKVLIAKKPGERFPAAPL
jgi:hypothetical protein